MRILKSIEVEALHERAMTGVERAKADVRKARFQRRIDGKKVPVSWPKIDTSGLGPCCVELIHAQSPKKEKDGRELVCPGAGCTSVLVLDHGRWRLKYFWSDGGKRVSNGMLPGFSEIRVKESK